LQALRNHPIIQATLASLLLRTAAQAEITVLSRRHHRHPAIEVWQLKNKASVSLPFFVVIHYLSSDNLENSITDMAPDFTALSLPKAEV
jgi:hypothetical protein